MAASFSSNCTAFDGHRLLAAGARLDVALALKRALEAGAAGPLLAFDDATGAVIDFDLSVSDADIATRLAEPEPAPRGRGRPKLGVVAREVTLLPRHWEWLAAQSGGASVALRRLVDEARRTDGGATQARQAVGAAYRFLHAIAGDFPGFEEASRALFAGDREGFARADRRVAARYRRARAAAADQRRCGALRRRGEIVELSPRMPGRERTVGNGGVRDSRSRASRLPRRCKACRLRRSRRLPGYGSPRRFVVRPRLVPRFRGDDTCRLVGRVSARARASTRVLGHSSNGQGTNTVRRPC